MKNEITIFGEIGSQPGQTSAADIHHALAAADRSQVLTVRIHSEGGSLFEGLAIHDALKAYDGPIRATVESCAFSAASLIICAIPDVAISSNGWTMVHGARIDGPQRANCSAEQLLIRVRDSMANIYAAKCKRPLREIYSWLDGERFFNASETVSVGLATSITGASPAIPSIAARGRMPKRSASSIWRELVAYEITQLSARRRPTSDTPAAAMAAVDRQYPGLRHRMLAEHQRV